MFDCISKTELIWTTLVSGWVGSEATQTRWTVVPLSAVFYYHQIFVLTTFASIAQMTVISAFRSYFGVVGSCRTPDG